MFKVQGSMFEVSGLRLPVVGCRFAGQGLAFVGWRNLFSVLVFLFIGYCLPLAASAQRLDNVTDDEDTMIRQATEVDDRMNVYVHIIDRRFLALTDAAAAQSKQAQKDFEKYGKLRTGDALKLQSDIARTLAEAVGKIDDVAERDQKNPLFPKAVRILTKACERWEPQLKISFDKAADDGEKAAISNSMDQCNDVIEASSKLPQAMPKDDRKKKSKDSTN